MQALYEQYRPTTWDGVVGQEKAVKRINTIRKRGGLGGRAYWLAGNSGTGKTTIARIMASEVAGAFATEELDATDLSAAKLREVERKTTTRAIDGAGWAFIINEAHGLNKAAIRRSCDCAD